MWPHMVPKSTQRLLQHFLAADHPNLAASLAQGLQQHKQQAVCVDPLTWAGLSWAFCSRVRKEEEEEAEEKAERLCLLFYQERASKENEDKQ